MLGKRKRLTVCDFDWRGWMLMGVGSKFWCAQYWSSVDGISRPFFLLVSSSVLWLMRLRSWLTCLVNPPLNRPILSLVGRELQLIPLWRESRMLLLVNSWAHLREKALRYVEIETVWLRYWIIQRDEWSSRVDLSISTQPVSFPTLLFHDNWDY